MREYETQQHEIDGHTVIVERMPIGRAARESAGYADDQRYYYSTEGFGGGYARTVREALAYARTDLASERPSDGPLPVDSRGSEYDGMEGPADRPYEWDVEQDDPPGERTTSAFCDDYAVHEHHAYRAINHSTYLCPGLSVVELAACEELWNQPPCEHGMSAHLCAGPMHYPADR